MKAKQKRIPTGSLTERFIMSLYPHEAELFRRICAAHHPELASQPNRTGATLTFRAMILAEAARLGLLEDTPDED